MQDICMEMMGYDTVGIFPVSSRKHLLNLSEWATKCTHESTPYSHWNPSVYRLFNWMSAANRSKTGVER